ncbi:hypothetical protein M409DRAFT_18333 [Zasmidium cellare ATCC 36951]|uniref:AB hydrolase-1 domain-containing protein n=1 Tax=Zasmidium cellare ATCC 36951 TaxID=1080233 RepID=A0A6A6D0P3_ZASCE|nr:uncharacterized protein M409DRAFT_18333 [Zasmidium cellare ATCC 36951]KAF2171216.1 hypothetical protein M409DRAFT_18333 [Zasmidium cellare ATCC 36951]
MSTAYKTVQTSNLEVAYYDHGEKVGWPVVLSHGFPYDPHAFDEVVPHLTAKGARVIVPYLRGYGPTRFLSNATPRAGQQAALGSDLKELLDALEIEKAVLAGFNWGGLASCVVTALWPERVSGLVCYAGYDIIDRKAQLQPSTAGLECVMWYQHLFQYERGKVCLRNNRRELAQILWRQWSPTSPFIHKKFDDVAPSFDNVDFVDVVIGAYRHVLGTEEGDRSLESLEERLATLPAITVPCITLDGTQDPLKPGGSAAHAHHFVGRHERREYDVGHAFPLEEPKAFADAILDVHQWSSE